MKSEKYLLSGNPSCCAPYRTTNLNGSGVREQSASTCELLLRRIAIYLRPWQNANSAAISTRLHVFPLHLPSLHERREDIPLLVRYFVQKFARRMGKQIEAIPVEDMEALERWHWPGNIRELENFLERSVILTEGARLHVPIGELCNVNAMTIDANGGRPGHRPFPGTLEELERQYILQVLHQADWVISGSDGAAARLGMKRTTLQSKMVRMGITKEEYVD